MAISTPDRPRDRRFQLRATAREENSDQSGGRPARDQCHGFILGAAREKAEQTLADQMRFILNRQQWKRFMEALDQPPREKPRLRSCFRKSHVAERRT